MRSASVKELRSFRSAPTQNALASVLVISTTRTSRSAERWAQAAPRSRAIWVDTAFIASGRSSASSATSPLGPCRAIVTIVGLRAFSSLMIQVSSVIAIVSDIIFTYVVVSHVISIRILFAQVVVAHHAPAPRLDGPSKHPRCHGSNTAQGPATQHGRLETRCARKGSRDRIIYQDGFGPRYCCQPAGSVHRVPEDVTEA